MYNQLGGINLRKNIDDMWNKSKSKLTEDLFDEMKKEKLSNETFENFIKEFNDNPIELINGTVEACLSIEENDSLGYYLLYYVDGIKYEEKIGSVFKEAFTLKPLCKHYRNLSLIKNPESLDWIIDWFYEIIENKKVELEKKRKTSKKLREEISKNKLVKSEEE